MAGPAVFLDSNLLVLYVVGTASPEYIRRHRRLSAYSRLGRRAFDVLLDSISSASALLVTPNVLTEVSNLLGGRVRDDELSFSVINAFRWLVERLEERNAASSLAVTRLEFPRLGLADAATLEALGPDAVLLTDDALLYDATLRAGMRAELFSHHLAAAGLA